MTRTRRFAASAAGSLLFAGLLLSAVGAAPGESPDPSPAPVYPSAQPGTGDSDAGTIRIPSVSAQEERLYLAVSDAARDEIDTAAIIDATRDAVAAQEADILIGIAQEPTNLKGAGQLVRGLLLFGDSDALAEDWLENGKTLGYVGEGWIVVGIMLPEDPADEVEVFVDPGRDISEAEPGSSQEILVAGETAFKAADYTAGITEVALATTQQLQAPPDRTLAKVIAVGVLAVAIVFMLVWAWRAKRRKARKAAAAERLKQEELLESRIRQASRFLGRTPVPDLGLPEQGRVARVMSELEKQRAGTQRGAQHAQDLEPGIADQEQVSEKQLADLRRREQELALLRGAVQLAHGFATRPRDARQAWDRIFDYHRARLEDLALFLDLPGAGQLGCPQAARTVIITHTDELQLLRTRVGRRNTGAEDAPGILERLWELRDELDGVLRDALAQAGQQRLKVPQGLGERMAGRQPAADALENDPIAVLRNFLPGSGAR